MRILYFDNKGHIENEVDMNDVKTCRHNCKTYDVTEPKHCYKNLFCAKQQGCKIPTPDGGRLKYKYNCFQIMKI